MYQVPPMAVLAELGSREQIDFFYKELERISDAFGLVEAGQFLQKRSAAPAKKKDGMLVYADGTNWNPGSGAGFYFWNGASWIPLHT